MAKKKEKWQKREKNLSGDGEEEEEEEGGESRVQNSPKAFGELIIVLCKDDANKNQLFIRQLLNQKMNQKSTMGLQKTNSKRDFYNTCRHLTQI